MATEKNPLSVLPDEIRELIELECSDIYSTDINAINYSRLSGIHDRAVRIQEDLDWDEYKAIVSAYLKYKNKDVKNTALTRLLAKIENVNKKEYKGILAGSKRGNAAAAEIATFPLPSDKEELLEIIYYIKPYLKKQHNGSDYEGAIIEAFKTRFKEIREMVNSRYPNDPELTAAVYVKPGFMARLFSKIFGKK